MKTIGVLGMQGAVVEHMKKIAAVGARPRNVRTRDGLQSIDGLILPGGESTAIGKLLNDFQLMEPLRQQISKGMPVWGTCAGLILLAKKICGQTGTYLHLMDITARRNAYGGQLNSFRTFAYIKPVAKEKLPLVFIRAPYIEKIGKDVTPLAEIEGHIVAAQQGNMLVTSFHPELTEDLHFHQYFAARCN